MQNARQDITHKETVLIAMGNWLQKLYMGCIKTDDRQQVVGLMYAAPCIIVRSSQAISSRCWLLHVSYIFRSECLYFLNVSSSGVFVILLSVSCSSVHWICNFGLNFLPVALGEKC